MFFSAVNNKDEDYYKFNVKNALKIPNHPIAFWLKDLMIKTFNQKYVKDISTAKAGVVTGNDDYFLKIWYEIDNDKISLQNKSINTKKKYFSFQKGGSYQRWYGNYEYVIAINELYINDKCNKSVRRGDKEYYFKTAIGWSQIGSNYEKSYRIIQDSICGTATPTLYFEDKLNYYILTLLNSKYSECLINMYNPTLNLLTTDVGNIPIIIDYDKLRIVDKIVDKIIANKIGIPLKPLGISKSIRWCRVWKQKN